MPNLTRADIRNRIRDAIADTGTNAIKRWSDSQINNKIEEWHEQFVKDTRIFIDIQSISLVDGTQEYSLNTDVFDINRVVANGIELNRISKIDLDFYTNADWANSGLRGGLQYYYVDPDPDNFVIGIVDTPGSGDAGTNNLKIEYVKVPSALADDSDTPFDSFTLLQPYHMALVWGSAADLAMMDPTKENLTKIKQFRVAYDILVEDAIKLFRSMSQTEPLRIKGGRYYKGK